MNFNHIIWDFDGTLFDTYPVMAKAFSDTLLKRGIKESAFEIERLMKISMSHAINHYEDVYGLDDAFYKDFDDLSNEEQKIYVKPFDNIQDVCKQIIGNGGYNYLYTHRGNSSIFFLDKYGLSTSFRELITNKSNFPRKPSPEAILYLLDKYSVSPGNALMVGDREIDISAAKNAGISSCYFNIDKDTCEQASISISKFIELKLYLAIK